MRTSRYIGAGAVLLVLFVVSVVVFPSVRNAIPLPMGLRHVLNIFLNPSDLYEPIVLDQFQFDQQGFSKTYLLRPRYLDIYEVGLLNPHGAIPSTYRFSGKVKLEFLKNHRVIREVVVSTQGAAVYADKELTRYRKIALHEFLIPLNGVVEGLSLRVTVVEPDSGFTALEEKPSLHISVSSRL